MHSGSRLKDELRDFHEELCGAVLDPNNRVYFMKVLHGYRAASLSGID
jgi:hypothetical protein